MAPGDPYGDLCCAQNHVAYRAEREGACGCLRADRGLWGRRCFRSLSRQRNIFSAGLRSRPSRCGPTMSRSTGLTCTLRPARNSSGACSIVLGRRIAKRGRCRTSHAVRVAREPSTGPKLCCAGKPRSPVTAPTFGPGQHSSARNIGRYRDRRAPPELPTPFVAEHSCDAGDQRDRGVAEVIAGWREGPGGGDRGLWRLPAHQHSSVRSPVANCSSAPEAQRGCRRGRERFAACGFSAFS